MTSILFVGDLHLGSRTFPVKRDGLTFKDERALENLDIGLNYKKVDAVVFLGDIYDIPRPSEELQSHFNNRLAQLLQKKTEIVIIVGNHERTASFTAFDPLVEILPQVNIVSKPTYLMVGDVGLVCLPWSVSMARKGWSEQFGKLLDRSVLKKLGLLNDVSNSLHVLIAGHLPVDGALVGASNYRLDNQGIKLKQFRKFSELFDAEYVFLGHYHKAQMMGGVIDYVGSIDRIDFGEKNDDKRVMLYDDGSVADIQLDPTEFVEINSPEQLQEAIVDGVTGVVKVDMKVTPEFAAGFDSVACRQSLFNAGAQHIMPLRVTATRAVNVEENEKKLQLYGGILEDATKYYIRETFGSELNDEELTKLESKALELLEE